MITAQELIDFLETVDPNLPVMIFTDTLDLLRYYEVDYVGDGTTDTYKAVILE